jgi:MFS family permease
LRASYASIAALLIAVFGVLAGNGVLTTLVPVRAKLEGFPDVDIGLMGSAYFLGMLAGATITPFLVQRLGHLRAFGFSSAIGALAILALGAFVKPLAWIVIRGLCGFFLAGIYAIVESYLQGKAENRIRGRLLGIYSITQYAGWAVGGQMMRLGDPAAFTIFGIAAAVVVAFLTPLFLVSAAAHPPGSRLPSMNLAFLYRTSPVGCVCTVLIGFANGPFWSLTPVYATAQGMSAVATGTLMTSVTIGAAASQFPVGRISDALDRRVVLVGLASLTGLLEIWLYAAGDRLVGWPLILVGGVMGGMIAPQYYVTSAHTNDRTGRDNAVRVAASLLFLYCIGAILGPITASLTMQWLGAPALYLHNLGLHVAIAVFVTLRILRRPAPGRRAEGAALETAGPAGPP